MKLSARLAALAFSRTLTPRAVAAACVLFGLVAFRDWAPPYVLLDAESHGRSAESVARAFTRHGIWSGACACAIPFLLFRAARAGRRSVREDRGWIGSRAIAPLSVYASQWLGLAAASVLLVVSVALAIEVLLPESGPSFRLRRGAALGDVGWVEGSRLVSVTLGEPVISAPRGSRISLEVGLGSSASATSELVARARRARGERSSTASVRTTDHATPPHAEPAHAEPAHAEPAHDDSPRDVADAPDGAARSWDVESRARIATRGTIEIGVPDGTGPIELVLATTDDDARFYVLSRRADLWTPVASERAGSLAIATRLALACAGWSALCFGLATLVRPSIAVALVLATWLSLAFGGAGSRWWPSADLPRALDLARDGRVPSLLPVASLAAALVLVAVGALLAGAGLARAGRDA